MSRHALSFVLVATAVATAVVTAVVGCFSLERTRDIEPGSVTGAAIDEGGARIAAVTVTVEGTGQTRNSQDGSFYVAGLPAGRFTLRLTSDADNDGVVDRGARLPFLLDVGADDRVGFVLFGDVVLPTTATIRGRIVDADGVGVVGARVVAAAIEDDVVSEAVAATDSVAGGVFVLEGVLAGAVTVVASAPGAASVGVGKTVSGGDDVDVGDVAVVAGGADLSVTLTTVPDIDVDAVFVRRPDSARTVVPADVVTVAPGVFDLEVSAAAGNGNGVLRDLAMPRDRQALRVVIVLEGIEVQPPDGRPGENGSGGGDPADAGVEVPTEPVDPEQPAPECGVDVTITNGVYAPPSSTFAGCSDLASLTITGGTPDLSPLASLQSVRFAVVIEDTTLTSLAGLGALRDAQSITIRNNAALTTLSLPSLSSAQSSLVLDGNGTQRLELPVFTGAELVEIANMPALTQVVRGQSAPVQRLLLRGELGNLVVLYTAFSSAQAMALDGMVNPTLPVIEGRSLTLSNISSLSFASLSTVRQMREVVVEASAFDAAALNAWRPDIVDIVSFTDNFGITDAEVTSWIATFIGTPQTQTVSGNVR